MFNLIDLQGKHIVVTGASRGIGRETAILCSRLGARITCVARNEENLKKTVSLLEGSGHGYMQIDFEQIDEIDSAVQKLVETYGAVDGLVYAAGIAIDYPLNLMKPVYVDRVIRVDLLGFIEMVRCVSRKKRYNKGMRIVGISSTAAFSGGKAHLAYAAAKAWLNGAMRCMAVELARKGIAVNSVAPGMINTDMYRTWLSQKSDGTESDANKWLIGKQYLGIGEPKDVAAAIAFLLSPAARFITGICLPVDGGSLSH